MLSYVNTLGEGQTMIIIARTAEPLVPLTRLCECPPLKQIVLIILMS